MRQVQRFFLLVLLLSLAISTARAENGREFTEGRVDGGELRYINELPVLIVSGTPTEIGRQKGRLTGEAMKTLAQYPNKMLERGNRKDRLPKYQAMCKALTPQLPADHRDEMKAAAEQSGIDRDLGLQGNLLPDVYRGSFACSSLIVDADRSATGGPLFGRNLDFRTLGFLDKYNLVTVHRPKGKHAFVSIGFPGLFGCLSGMNDAGLALAVHEVFLSRDGAAMFNPKGVPYTFLFRRVLEECSTIAEAEKLIRSNERTTILSLALCDRHGSAVIEMTPERAVERRGSDGILACTNHFRSDELASVLLPLGICNRYPKLIQVRKLERPLDISDVAKKMHEVNMGRMTVQTMIFEPATLKLHLAIGSCPASALPLKPLELKPLFSPVQH
ncbi:MAG: C45 family peptidase [Thermoguttaceae bacterium]